MNVAELEAFLAVYDTGTYTRAAEMLGISQPAVSRRISLLESDLGAALFERGRHGARSTPAGEAFAPFASRVLSELRAATRAVQELQAGERGRLTLAVAGTIPNSHLMHRLREFRARNPNAPLRISTGTSNEVSDMVMHGEAEAGLRYFPADNADLESRLVFREQGAIVAANPTALLDATPIDSAALSACPWIMFPVAEGSSGEPLAVHAMKTLNAAGILPAHIARVDGLSAQKRLVSADFGLALMQSSAVVDELAAGTLQQIGHGLVEIDFPVYLVLRKHRYSSTLRTRLIECLERIHHHEDE